ncbi:hypothetical protein [Spirosoma fluminis]
MATLTHSSSAYTTDSNWLSVYKNFAENAEFNRFGWACTAVAIQGCVLSPVLLLTLSYLGGGDWQFLTSMLCFLLVLVPVLSAMPAKVIFPTFAISFVIHLAMILMNIL